MVWYIKTQKKTQNIKKKKNNFFLSIFSMDNKNIHVYLSIL